MGLSPAQDFQELKLGGQSFLHYYVKDMVHYLISNEIQRCINYVCACGVNKQVSIPEFTKIDKEWSHSGGMRYDIVLRKGNSIVLIIEIANHLKVPKHKTVRMHKPWIEIDAKLFDGKNIVASRVAHINSWNTYSGCQSCKSTLIYTFMPDGLMFTRRCFINR